MVDAAKAPHGGNILATARELGCRPADLIDLSSNLSPLGMPAALRQLLVERIDEAGYLPETGSETLRQLFGARYDRTSEGVLVGNGTTEFIFAAPVVLPGDLAIIINPTYGDYRLACEGAGLPVRSLTLRPEEDFRLDYARLAAELRDGQLVFICNPNNPTSVLTPTAELHQFIGAHPGALFLVDESYLPFTRERSLLELPPLSNLLILSSYSKIFGIPGLRLGFLTAPPALLARFATLRKPWGVNRLAQVAGEFLVVNGHEHRQRTLAYLDEHRPAMAALLAGLPGVRVFPGNGNFLLSRLRGKLRVAELQQLLLQEHRIMIRDCRDFEGLADNYFRISLQAAGLQIAAAALLEVLGA